MINQIIKKYRAADTYLQIRIWMAVTTIAFSALLMNLLMISLLFAIEGWRYGVMLLIPLPIFLVAYIWGLGNMLMVVRIVSRDFDFRHKRGQFKVTYLPDDYDFSETP